MQALCRSAGISTVVMLLACAGCDETRKHDGSAPTASAVAAVGSAVPPPTATTPPPEPPKEPPKSERPEKIDVGLNAERRSKAEAAIPESKGFLVAVEIEEKLKAKKLKEKEGGVAAFDKAASGKWVLFTGPLANITDTGFDIGITYTPQIPGDMMGMSRQWFPVTFSDIKGYEKDKFKAGQVVVVLAKYGGKQKAGPGTELVDAKLW